jgi:uncharacterized protein
MKTIVITAANGFIGSALTEYFSTNFKVVALVRKPRPDKKNVRYVRWDGRTQGEWSSELEGAEAVINLAGRSVNCRYNERNRQFIYSSRLESTAAIGEAVKSSNVKPKVWMNAASATIYAHSEHVPNTEANGIIGSGFSVDVCLKWEAAFASFAQPGVRQITLRTSIVLGSGGGVMKPFLNLVRSGLGGKMGRGKQQFSWIHIDDLCRAVDFLLAHESSVGVYNIASPDPVTNAVFMRTLRNAARVPFGIPAPKWLLEAGAAIIGTETELVLKSRFVLPERLEDAGFRFRYPTIEKCIGAIVNERNTSE